LFGPDADAGVRLSSNICDGGEKLNDSYREEMDRRFAEEEVKKVIDQMEKNISVS
jgi:hypothetical protein